MTVLTTAREVAAAGRQRVNAAVGGARRMRVVTVFGAVLALEAADTAAVGAAGPQLQHALGIGKTDLGLLLAVTAIVGAVATVPAGMLVDRVRRVRLLSVAVLLWGVASAVSGLATGFAFLLLARLGLGVVIAVGGPAIASLVGDYFPERERGRIYGYILAGELVGTGFGFVVCGDLATLSWRASFFALVPPALVLAWVLRRLPEPARGGADRLEPDGGAYPDEPTTTPAPDAAPRPDNVIRTDGAELNLWQAVRYVLRVPSNVVLIVSSALGYFFFAGVRGFAIEFVRHQYGIGQATATALVPVIGLGMVVGVIASGRLADRLLGRGHCTARVTVAALSVLVAAVVFVPALLAPGVALALPLLAVAGCAMGAANPPLDAARLDVMPPRLWGRAEAVRTLLQAGAQAVAPVLFGYTAANVFPGGNGLQDTFLLSLVPLALSAALLLTVGRRTYPRDVATARRSRRTPDGD